MRDATARRLSGLHTLIYRATNGLVLRRLVNNDMLLLTTVGRHSGRPHTVPLLYLTDGPRLVVIASWGGRAANPDWYRNLGADPNAQVQVRGRRVAAVASTATENERAEWWPRVVAAYDGYATYQARTDRKIPVVFLDPTVLA